MRSDLVTDVATRDLCEQVGGVPGRGIGDIGAGIGSQPVTVEPRVPGTHQVGMRDPVSSLTPVEQQVADERPRRRNTVRVEHVEQATHLGTLVGEVVVELTGGAVDLAP